MVRGKVLVWVACVVAATCGLHAPPAAAQGHDAALNPWLSLPHPPRHAAATPLLLRLQRSHDDTMKDQDFDSREKRVFSSRGWGPGGYEVPPPPAPQRFVRRPPLAQAPRSNVKVKALPPPPLLLMGQGGGKARFAALVSPKRPETQQKPQYRRFHSIFTSGTWSPLGKRGMNIKVRTPFEASQEKFADNDEKILQEFSDWNVPVKIKDKRSGVFASHGWGAGGSLTRPLPSATSSWGASLHPRVTGRGSEDSSSSSSSRVDSYMASLRSGGPFFHHFLSHGWRPMGR